MNEEDFKRRLEDIIEKDYPEGWQSNYIELWWSTPNQSFNNEIPAEIFQTNPEKLERMLFQLESGVAN